VVATKLQAWLGRGGGDVLKSLDVHDIIVLVDGRTELIDELAVQPEELRAYVANELTSLREVDYFVYVIQAAVAAYADVANERAAIVADRLDAIIARLRAADFLRRRTSRASLSHDLGDPISSLNRIIVLPDADHSPACGSQSCVGVSIAALIRLDLLPPPSAVWIPRSSSSLQTRE
jgi:hypothetical protein